MRTGRHRMIHSRDRSPKRTPSCRLGRCLFRQASRPGRQQDLFSNWCESLKIPTLNHQHLVGARLRQCGIVQINPEVTWSQRKERWKRSSFGYPVAMLAARMALEKRSFSLVDRLGFIVTVNKGIEAPDCWILPLTDSSSGKYSAGDSERQIRRLGQGRLSSFSVPN